MFSTFCDSLWLYRAGSVGQTESLPHELPNTWHDPVWHSFSFKLFLDANTYDKNPYHEFVMAYLRDYCSLHTDIHCVRIIINNFLLFCIWQHHSSAAGQWITLHSLRVLGAPERVEEVSICRPHFHYTAVCLLFQTIALLSFKLQEKVIQMLYRRASILNESNCHKYIRIEDPETKIPVPLTVYTSFDAHLTDDNNRSI